VRDDEACFWEIDWENDFFSFKERVIKLFVYQTLAFNFHSRPLFIGDVSLQSKLKKSCCSFIQIQICAPLWCLESKCKKLSFWERSQDRSFCSSTFLGNKQHVFKRCSELYDRCRELYDRCSELYDRCKSLGGHLTWCKLDVIAWCHKMMSLMMSCRNFL